MTDKPILFKGEMVRAILDGRKTQTRRVFKPQPRSAPIRELDGVWNDCGGFDENAYGHLRVDVRPLKLKYAVGDTLWVRETCATWTGDHQDVVYRADETDEEWENLKHDAHLGAWKIRSPIHMPRWASRISLTVTDVRVQRLQDITEADAKAEGAKQRLPHLDGSDAPFPKLVGSPYSYGFAELWNSINGPDAWDQNPWVAAYTFEVQK